jgi:hypothetical protein
MFPCTLSYEENNEILRHGDLNMVKRLQMGLR